MASAADITARLTLNAKEFTARFDGAIDNAVTRARSGGAQVGRAFADTASDGLRSFAGEIPGVGGALTALSGVALGVAAGIGAIGVAAAAAVSGAEEYAQAARGLEAVLKATGNQTGFTTDQLKAFAEEQESALAISAEAIIGAEKVLASFGGVAGTTFERAITSAADLAAVYGGDLASNSEKLGLVLQNLAAGNVDGLSKSFKFLGTTTLDTIEALAKTGDTAAAQVALLDALEAKVGGAGASAGQGVAGAFFRLKDALGDTTRAFAEQSGLYGAVVSGLNAAADAAGKFGDEITSLNGLKLTGEVFKAALFGFDGRDAINRLTGNVAPAKPVGNGSIAFGNDPLADVGKFAGDLAARNAANAAKAEGDKARAVDAAAAAAKKSESEREQAAAKAVAAAKKADAERVARELQFQNIRIEGAAKDLQRLTELGAANDNFYQDWKGLNADKDKESRASSVQLVREIEGDFRYLSDTFFEVFSGRSGGIWGKFKELGARTLAELSAQFVIGGKLDLGGTSIGGLLSSLAGGKSGGGIGSLLGAAGSAAGLSGLIGSAGLGAVTIGTGGAAAAGGVASALAGTTIAGAGAGASGLLGAAAAAGPYALAAAGLIALGVAAFGNKKPEAFQSISGAGLGSLGGVKGSGKDESRAGASSLGQAGFGTLQQLAASLGGGLDPNRNLGALGVLDGKFTFDTTPGSGNNRRVFDTEAAAIEAFTRNAVGSGVITGVDASVAKLLSSGDLTTQTAKAQLLSNALKSFGAASDPTAGAIKALTDEFTALRDVMAEAGSSAADTAKASAEYDRRLQDIRKSAGQATTTLQNFLDDLNFGGSSPLAIGDQAAAARAAYGSLAAGIGSAGFDQSAFAAVGSRLIDITRQIEGQTPAFFATFNQVQADANRAIGAINNASGITGDNPFARKTADATAATADNTSMMAELMQALPAQIAAALAQYGGGGAFIGGDARGFAVAA